MTARIADRIDLDQVEETPWGGRREAVAAWERARDQLVAAALEHTGV